MIRQAPAHAHWLGESSSVALATRRVEHPLRTRVVDWDPLAPAHQAFAPAGSAAGSVGKLRSTQADEMFALVGRHPFLTRLQFADLLGTSAARVRVVQAELLRRGWIRQLEPDEFVNCHAGLIEKDLRAFGLVELTPAGRSELARRIVLTSSSAGRYHGIVGGERGRTGKRNRLLRHLAHTLGTNEVFVTFVAAARAARDLGGDEALEEWRGAASCERHRCRPDGYGRYRRGTLTFGFFLEFDRGTERSYEYAAKFEAYYRYRDSGAAAHDFDGFPTVLVVTTSGRAEERIAEAVRLAWNRHGSEPLFVLLTTTEHIRQHPASVLGPIWRTPAPGRLGSGVERGYWLPGRPQPSATVRRAATPVRPQRLPSKRNPSLQMPLPSSQRDVQLRSDSDGAQKPNA